MWEKDSANRFNDELLKKYTDERRWREAEALLQKALQEFPYDTEILTRLSMVLWKSGKHREALENLEKALMLDPDDARVIEAAVKIFVAIGRYEDARDIVTAYTERNPWESDNKERLCQLLVQQPDLLRMPPANALGGSNGVCENGSESTVLLRIGEEEFARQRFDRARVCFELAHEKDPSNAKALNNLGVVAWQDGDTASALDCFQRALDLDPLDGEILLNSARALGDAGQWETAVDLLEIYLSRHGNDDEAWSDYRRFVHASATPWRPDGLSEEVAQVYVETAKRLASLGDHQGAIEAYGRALKISDGMAEAYFGLGLLEQNLGRNTEAAEMFRTALELDPSHSQAAEALRQIQQEDGAPALDVPSPLDLSAAH